ncbi:Calcium-transporting ATPase [Rhynchospora pubera]|uniref:Calcium-transporting ATPase n=1 Tax=Rhynchospora pubera TaxID=906938 RepID=A0AAV8H708_9POAL|nr:Calcium-transporting ATPase [Rhynchospora pubera]
MARYFTGKTTNADGTVQYIKGQTSVKSAIDGVIKIFTVAVTIVVVAVPEGLPLAVTLTLACSMRKMMEDKALVRRLSACETMGSATTICSDKTGTLTLNQMTEGIAQNSTGSVYEPENGGAIEITGSPTEKAILGWGVELKMRSNEVRSKSSIIHASPFNSEKKCGGVAVSMVVWARSVGLVGPFRCSVHWKGAAEIILDLCTSWIDSSGAKHEMTPHVEKFKKQIEDMAAKSLRCVALAYKPLDLKEVPNEEERDNWSLPDNDLILLAIVGMKVRMVTGDNLQTAKAIALECGILSENERADDFIIEGMVFRALTDEQKEQAAEKIKVMARSSPTDKLQLVKALKKRGHVVAVTGDSTNDAPALHEANIGLAMGIQGTEVAKESSDIIILDDNFASVVKVVRWGRSVYARLQKFIQFQLTVNVAALIINVVAAVSSGNVPLNAVQLLWVNLIMDTLGALALATEPPTDSLMKRAPVGRREPLITNIMWRNLVIQALFQVAVLLTLNFNGRSLLQLNNYPMTKANKIKNTFIFNAFVLCQLSTFSSQLHPNS